MQALNPDFKALLDCLNSRNVRYLIIGGYAVNFHGYHRNTKDLDVWIAVDAKNAERVSLALQDFGFSPATVVAANFLKVDSVFAFGREPMRVDILTNPSGVDFAACYERRVEFDVDGTNVPFIARDDLIMNKRAAQRLKDQADLEGLS